MANLNLEQILDLFENGERRYAEDPAFKAAADSLKMGLGVYAVLDHVLREIAEAKDFLKRVIEQRNYFNRLYIETKEQLEGANVLIVSLQERQIVMTYEIFPGELKGLRDKVPALEQENQKLKDEVASWEDRYEALEQGENL